MEPSTAEDQQHQREERRQQHLEDLEPGEAQEQIEQRDDGAEPPRTTTHHQVGAGRVAGGALAVLRRRPRQRRHWPAGGCRGIGSGARWGGQRAAGSAVPAGHRRRSAAGFFRPPDAGGSARPPSETTQCATCARSPGCRTAPRPPTVRSRRGSSDDRHQPRTAGPAAATMASWRSRWRTGTSALRRPLSVDASAPAACVGAAAPVQRA